MILKPFIVVGGGAGGVGVALAHLAASNKSPNKNLDFINKNPQQLPLLIEQHATLGGCAGFFIRQHPKRFYDVGATQLTACLENQIQANIFQEANIAPSSAFKYQKYSFCEQVFCEDNIDLRIRVYASGKVEVIGNYSEYFTFEDCRQLETFLNRTYKLAKYLWKYLETYPKLPITSFADVVYNLKRLLKQHPLTWILSALGSFLPFEIYLKLANFSILPLNKFSRRIIDGLLLDTTQTNSKNTSILAGIMGCTVIQAGMYRCNKGMIEFWSRLESGLLKSKKIEIQKHLHVTNILTKEDYWEVSTTSQGMEKKYYTKNLFLNTTLWNAANLLKDIPEVKRNKIFQQWTNKLEVLAEKKEEVVTWKAIALYGQMYNKINWTENPFTFQIFSDIRFQTSEFQKFFRHPIYVSVSALQEHNLRTFTASIHISIEHDFDDIYNTIEAKTRLQTEFETRILTGIFGSLEHHVRILQAELATPKTFARYTMRHQGYVGGFPQTYRNPIAFDVNPTIQLKSKSISIVGDSVAPGQSILSGFLGARMAYQRQFPDSL